MFREAVGIDNVQSFGVCFHSNALVLRQSKKLTLFEVFREFGKPSDKETTMESNKDRSILT